MLKTSPNLTNQSDCEMPIKLFKKQGSLLWHAHLHMPHHIWPSIIVPKQLSRHALISHTFASLDLSCSYKYLGQAGASLLLKVIMHVEASAWLCHGEAMPRRCLLMDETQTGLGRAKPDTSYCMRQRMRSEYSWRRGKWLEVILVLWLTFWGIQRKTNWHFNGFYKAKTCVNLWKCKILKADLHGCKSDDSSVDNCFIWEHKLPTVISP
jgi:hypothetical protein